MADNAAKFNGSDHAIADAGRNLCNKILDQVDDVLPITGIRAKIRQALQERAAAAE